MSDSAFMQILFLDETNVIQTKINNFFIYGGIFFSAEQAAILHKRIIEIREKADYKAGDLLKFDTHTRPPHVSAHLFNTAKEELINACIENKVLFIVYIVHHNIAQRHSLETKIQWASNELINQFDIILKQQKDYGVVIFDKLPFKAEFRYISKLFNSGITTATTQKTPHIPTNILSYSMSTAGASHFDSATDVVLGAFRYCVNAESTSKAAKKLFPMILKLIYGHIGKDGKKTVGEYGLLIRPHLHLAYKPEYDTLISKLKAFL